jgi:hypothetical protein
MSRVFYGVSQEEMVDITPITVLKCVDESQTLIIPIGDPERSVLFGMDPYYGQLKSVFIVDVNGQSVCYDHMTPVNIPNFA